MNSQAMDAARQSGSHRRAQMIVAAGLIPLCILLLLNLYHALQYCLIGLRYPYELDYGEGIVLQQMRDIVAGHGYAPLGIYPAIVYHYPPVYHLTVAAWAAVTGMDELFAGRLVSIISTFVTAALVGVLTASLIDRRGSGRTRLTIGIVSGLLFLSCNPVLAWLTLMRVDMLSYVFTFAGLALSCRCSDRPLHTLGAGLMFTLAIYTKQTSIAAPAAAVIGMLIVAPRQAMLLIATCLVLGSTALAWMIWNYGGQFLQHIILYNLNRSDLSLLARLLLEFEWQGILIAVALVGFAATVRRNWMLWSETRSFPEWRTRLKNDPVACASIQLGIFLILKTMMMPMVLKSGANINYLIEWQAVIVIFATSALAPFFLLVCGRESIRQSALFGAIVMGALALQVYTITRWDAVSYSQELKARGRNMAKIVDVIRSCPRPVISDDMVLLIRAGRRVSWEPAIAAELGSKGMYNEKKFAEMVRQGAFGFFITSRFRVKHMHYSRYNPVVADAIDEAYPEKRSYAGLAFHFPAGTPSNIFEDVPSRSANNTAGTSSQSAFE